MKAKIERYFLNKNYFIICPRAYSIGGFFLSLNESLKAAAYKKKKIVICFLLLNNHSKHYQKKIFSIQILLPIFFQLGFYEKIVSIILSIYININLVLERIKILSLAKIIFGKKLIENFFFCRIGYDGYPGYLLITNYEWKKALSLKNNFFFKKNKITEKINKFHFITIYAKDINYNKISEISLSGLSDINSYYKSIKYFIDKKIQVVRVGDQLSKSFFFNSCNYYDFTSSNIFNLKNQYLLYEKSIFYFGSSSPGSLIANFFNKDFIIPNHNSFSDNAKSFSMNNCIIYKKVFSIKEKKILSLAEIFNKNEYFIEELGGLNNRREFILIENSEDEILNLCKIFYCYNFTKNNYSINHKLLNEYSEIRKNAIDKFYKKNVNANLFPSLSLYYYAKVNIPNFFLEKYLYPNKLLEKESLYYKNKFKL
jgi:putative glycosyltransferase (TIGR04372 family)